VSREELIQHVAPFTGVIAEWRRHLIVPRSTRKLGLWNPIIMAGEDPEILAG